VEWRHRQGVRHSCIVIQPRFSRELIIVTYQIGVKFTHNGAVAIFRDGELVACHEGEKAENGGRYSEIDRDFVLSALAAEGILMTEVDRIVVDGWSKGPESSHLERNGLRFPVADYGDLDAHSILKPMRVDVRLFAGGPPEYTSTTHVGGHVAGSYATSPFAEEGEPSYVVMWDGGTTPRLFYVNPDERAPRFVAELGNVYGSAYSVFPLHFEPYRRPDEWLAQRPKNLASQGVAGKAMAFAGLGQPTEVMIEKIKSLVAESPGTWDGSFQLVDDFVAHFGLDRRNEQDSADAIAAFDIGLGESFVSNLQAAIIADQRVYRTSGNVCLSGGCALNLRWNTSVRELTAVNDVWVPPFPDDSGGAIGAMMADRFSRLGAHALKWNVYSGPAVKPSMAKHSMPVSRWNPVPATPSEIGRWLHDSGKPIVVLHGRAELGPRALGSRSILCAPHADAKDLLNALKKRESFRPVAPVCLARRAGDVFLPGRSDPYMLFTHEVKPEWLDRIPAVLHVDGTARLQTVEKEQSPVLHEILMAYYEASGIPVLCNTSANFLGKGFFPGVDDALRWGKAAVWDGDRGILHGVHRFLAPEHNGGFSLSGVELDLS
jgi:carbamoyltransferase